MIGDDSRPGWFASLLFIALIFIWGGGLDRDLGGYADSFRTRDKLYHALAAFGLTVLGVAAFGVRPAVAGWMVLAAGVLFEVVQWRPRDGTPGWFSWRDIVADAAGALAAVLLLDLWL